jgi:hypothetical protein
MITPSFSAPTVIACILSLASVIALPLNETTTLSFLIIGDWGEPSNVASEIKVAAQMNVVATEYDSKFVVAVGTNL